MAQNSDITWKNDGMPPSIACCSGGPAGGHSFLPPQRLLWYCEFSG